MQVIGTNETRGLEPCRSTDLSRRSLFLSFLKSGLEKLQEECHWLRAVTWDLCARCNLCPPQCVTKTGECVWHGKKECLHDDCAHYVSLTRKPVRCARTKGRNCCPPKTWSQVSENKWRLNTRFLRCTCMKTGISM